MSTPTIRPWAPFYLVLAATVAGILLVVFCGPLETEADWSRIYRCSPLDDDKPSSAAALECPKDKRLVNTELEHAKKVLEKRLDRYETELGQLRTMFWIQLLLVIFAFVVLWTKPEQVKVPAIDLIVPAKWIHIAIPIALVYLSVAVGYLFDHLIQERYFLWQQTIAIEGGRGTSIHSFGPLVDDRWVMDIWFSEFHPTSMSTQGLGASVWMARHLLLFGFGGFIAAQQVCIFALLERSKFPERRRWTGVWLLCFALALAVLVLNHVSFWLVGGNRNWVQPLSICPLTVGGYALWIWQSNKHLGAKQRAVDSNHQS